MTQSFVELQRQAEVMRAQIPADIATRPGITLDSYYAELQEQYAPEAVRTAIWDLIANRTVIVLQPGNMLSVGESNPGQVVPSSVSAS